VGSNCFTRITCPHILPVYSRYDGGINTFAKVEYYRNISNGFTVSVEMETAVL